ncbi:MAG: hypothetical protein WBD99_00230 [Thermodesulfobacteriota bacterium]
MLAIKGGRTRVYLDGLFLPSDLLSKFIRFEKNHTKDGKII